MSKGNKKSKSQKTAVSHEHTTGSPSQALDALSLAEASHTRMSNERLGAENLQASESHKTGRGAVVEEPQESREGQTSEVIPFEESVNEWFVECFGEEGAANKQERVQRFVEDAMKTARLFGCSAAEAHKLVDYAFNKPAGEAKQEIGGTYLMLIQLGSSVGITPREAGFEELKRIHKNIEAIREKRNTKPRFSALPQ